MKKLLYAAALACAALVSACQTTSAGDITSPAVLATEAAEIAARERCPRTSIEIAVLVGLRRAFDLRVGQGLGESDRERIEAARGATDRVCRIAPASTAAAEAYAVQAAPD